MSLLPASNQHVEHGVVAESKTLFGLALCEFLLLLQLLLLMAVAAAVLAIGAERWLLLPLMPLLLMRSPITDHPLRDKQCLFPAPPQAGCCPRHWRGKVLVSL